MILFQKSSIILHHGYRSFPLAQTKMRAGKKNNYGGHYIQALAYKIQNLYYKPILIIDWIR